MRPRSASPCASRHSPHGALLRWACALVLALLVAGASSLLPGPTAPGAAAAPSNSIASENAQPGTSSWRIGRTGYQPSSTTGHQIEGYASATSVGKGESIDFHVSVYPPQTYDLDVYRLGWYQGQGGRQMKHVAGLGGTTQPACPADADTGLRACRWAVGHSFAVPSDWTSGVYLALLTNAQHYQSYVVFVVRDDRGSSDLLYQVAVGTYQAYNNYPDDRASGKSLYGFNSYGTNTVSGQKQAVKVSFDRPYAAQSGAGRLMDWDLPLIRWLERSGYDVSYATDLDTHAGRSRLASHKGLLVAGHDEYWSKEMYDAVTAARDNGVSLAFLGADAADWQARLEPSRTGAPDRVLVCYRKAALDPIAEPERKTVRWSEPPLNRPQQALLGVQFAAQVQSMADLSIADNSVWPIAGTGLYPRSRVPGIVGYEVDRVQPDAPTPANRSFAVLARSPVVAIDGSPSEADTTIYQAPSGAWVFASGTMSWAWALDDAFRPDPRLQQVTSSLLDVLVGQAPAPIQVAPALQPAGVAPATAPNPAPTPAAPAPLPVGPPLVVPGLPVLVAPAPADAQTTAPLPPDTAPTEGVPPEGIEDLPAVSTGSDISSPDAPLQPAVAPGLDETGDS